MSSETINRIAISFFVIGLFFLIFSFIVFSDKSWLGKKLFLSCILIGIVVILMSIGLFWFARKQGQMQVKIVK